MMKSNLAAIACLALTACSQYLVIGGRSLAADEPVALHAIQIPRRECVEIVIGLQRLARPEIVVMIVLDVPERRDDDDAMMIGARGCPGNALKGP